MIIVSYLIETIINNIHGFSCIFRPLIIKLIHFASDTSLEIETNKYIKYKIENV